MDLEIDDPVHATVEGNKKLEGVVAYLDTADQRVGVRLTGPSVGLGQHDGFVDGTSYFSCPPNCGIIVPASDVTKRNLSRLDALRLKRELASSSTSTTTRPSTTTTTRSTAATPSTRTSTSNDPAANTPSTAPRATSKLEELRRRRAALEGRGREDGTAAVATTEVPAAAPASSPPAATVPPPAVAASKPKDVPKKSETPKKTTPAPTTTTPPRKPATKTTTEIATDDTHTQEQIQKLQEELSSTQERLDTTLADMTHLRHTLTREKELRTQDQDALVQAHAEAAALSKELELRSSEQETTQRNASQHYKERAKAQADMSALQRKVTQLEQDKVELEHTIEDLTLDKEQLQQEKDTLEDQFEELKIDAETAQIQVDELRMELEDAQHVAAQRTAASDTTTVADMDAEDKAQALVVQNSRLREALIRLREQSSVDKLEFQRQFREAGKDAEAGRALVSEVESLRSAKTGMEEQINDLKDMVEQGAAFESMVEDLSDRVLSLEEDNVALQTTIREMEEAQELTVEMEEVQAEELKALSVDLEGRDTIIRNLEEAIKMQRRREEDLSRSVSNYRSAVNTLKMEKQALLDLQQGGEGEKSNLIASSQKALAKAAQLVADADAMRKREAQAVADKVDGQAFRHLSTRLESLLPHAAVSAEVAAMKGEILASKIVDKGSQSLHAIEKWFSENTQPALCESIADVSALETALTLTDETKMEITATLHQAEYACEIADSSSRVVRFLAAAQWPDQMDPEGSVQLGAALGHTLLELDGVLGHALESLKEEGQVTPEQSNVELLRQTTQNAVQSIETDLVRGNDSLLSPAWEPPSLQIFSEMTKSKFACFGANAVLSLLVNENQSGASSVLSNMLNKVEQCNGQVSTSCLKLANLDISDTKLISTLSGLVSSVYDESSKLLESVKLFALSGGDATACEATSDATLKEISKLSACLRSSNLNQNDEGRVHPLSPEVDDLWSNMTSTICALRALDGDVDDVNFRHRSRQIENRLELAVENEPKLDMAKTKIAALEKSLASRSKEIAMQNARLSELERVLAKSNVSVVRTSDVKSSEEYNTLKEENRMLTEAMEVLQRQVDDYDRVVKDFKTPKRGGPASAVKTPARRRGVSPMRELGSPTGGSLASAASTLSLEATLFRPALQLALQESWKWKAMATSTAMAKLRPLPTPLYSPDISARKDDLLQLSSAMNELRKQQASVKLVKLKDSQKTPRLQLHENRVGCWEASRKLETIAARIRANQ